MAHRLTPEAAAAWLNRFSAFGDAVIRSLTGQEQATGAGREAIVRLDAQDNDAEGTWARVTLTVQDLDEFRLIQGPGESPSDASSAWKMISAPSSDSLRWEVCHNPKN